MLLARAVVRRTGTSLRRRYLSSTIERPDLHSTAHDSAQDMRGDPAAGVSSGGRVVAYPFLHPNKPSEGGQPPPTESFPASFGSVTRILDKTQSTERQRILYLWKRKMIRELGEDGFKKMQEETLGKGKNVHHCIKQFLEGTPPEEMEISENVRGYWSSVQNALSQVDTVVALERRVVHSALQYKGIVDCLAFFRGDLCVIDWKMSSKPKPTLSHCYDNPLQTAAYAGAVNYDPSYTSQVDRTVLVIAYEDGSPAHVHVMPPKVTLHYWDQWCVRLDLYTQLLKKQDKDQ